jgi:hypothetical protein
MLSEPRTETGMVYGQYTPIQPVDSLFNFHNRALLASRKPTRFAKDYPRYLKILKEHPHKSPHSVAEKGLRRSIIVCKSMKDLAPQVGFEPTTLRLTAECSTVELLRSNINGRTVLWYTIHSGRFKQQQSVRYPTTKEAGSRASTSLRNKLKPSRCRADRGYTMWRVK